MSGCLSMLLILEPISGIYILTEHHLLPSDFEVCWQKKSGRDCLSVTYDHQTFYE